MDFDNFGVLREELSSLGGCGSGKILFGGGEHVGETEESVPFVPFAEGVSRLGLDMGEGIED